ncbi:TRAP transporter small permease [Paraglaciecola chathamensis]|uniref:TRAP transporter small permease n=1 Tax=Paraglaciecola chathamensis TaxID=368405 RepID=UPI000587F861|nr:TRAP transporter small permease [Paraglaciecola agarilytica]
MSTFKSFIVNLNRVLRVLLASMMALLVINVTWQVITRFVLPHPSSFTEELARFLLIWISLLGSAYAFHTHSHLGFDYLVNKMSRSTSILVAKMGYVLVILFAISVLVVGGLNLAYITLLLEQRSAVLGLPMGAVYAVTPISGLLFIVYSILGLLELKDSNKLREVAL